jgi:hypothetical protein
MKGILQALDGFEFTVQFSNTSTSNKEVWFGGDFFIIPSSGGISVSVSGFKEVSANGSAITQAPIDRLVSLISRYPLIVDTMYLKNVSNLVGGSIRYFSVLGQKLGDETGFIRILPDQYQADIVVFRNLHILLSQFTGLSFTLKASNGSTPVTVEAIFTCLGVYTGVEKVRMPGFASVGSGGGLPAPSVTVVPTTSVNNSSPVYVGNPALNAPID